jgi:hypothetical protein
METIFVKRMAGKSNCFFWGIDVLLKISVKIIFKYLIANIERMLYCAEYNLLEFN